LRSKPAGFPDGFDDAAYVRPRDFNDDAAYVSLSDKEKMFVDNRYTSINLRYHFAWRLIAEAQRGRTIEVLEAETAAAIIKLLKILGERKAISMLTKTDGSFLRQCLTEMKDLGGILNLPKAMEMADRYNAYLRILKESGFDNYRTYYLQAIETIRTVLSDESLSGLFVGRYTLNFHDESGALNMNERGVLSTILGFADNKGPRDPSMKELQFALAIVSNIKERKVEEAQGEDGQDIAESGAAYSQLSTYQGEIIDSICADSAVREILAKVMIIPSSKYSDGQAIIDLNGLGLDVGLAAAYVRQANAPLGMAGGMPDDHNRDSTAAEILASTARFQQQQSYEKLFTGAYHGLLLTYLRDAINTVTVGNYTNEEIRDIFQIKLTAILNGVREAEPKRLEESDI